LSNQLAAEPHYRRILCLDLSQYQNLPDRGYKAVDGKRPQRSHAESYYAVMKEWELDGCAFFRTHASRTAFARRGFLPRIGVVEEPSKLEGGTRDTRLYHLIASTHSMVVMDSSMDLHSGIFRFYGGRQEELILSTSLQSQYFVLGNSPTGHLEICRRATRACMYANVLSFCIESSFPLS
jgi:hypothetical protein